MVLTNMMIGLIGENLVCADIRKLGYKAFGTTPDCAYDVVADTGSQLLRLQVKTVMGPFRRTSKYSPIWQFNLRRTAITSGNIRKTCYYQNGDYDLLAAVALDLNSVAYLTDTCSRKTLNIRSHDHCYGSNGRSNSYYFEDLTFDKAVAEMGLNV
jgi:hypothetical protein